MGAKFSRINFHQNVVDRFQEFAKENEVSYTDAMSTMLDFFEGNNISPFRPYNNTISSITDTIDRRMDALEAILRKIETEQLIPTRELLESLFQEKPVFKVPMFVERKFRDRY